MSLSLAMCIVPRNIVVRFVTTAIVWHFLPPGRFQTHSSTLLRRLESLQLCLVAVVILVSVNSWIAHFSSCVQTVAGTSVEAPSVARARLLQAAVTEQVVSEATPVTGTVSPTSPAVFRVSYLNQHERVCRHSGHQRTTFSAH